MVFEVRLGFCRRDRRPSEITGRACWLTKPWLHFETDPSGREYEYEEEMSDMEVEVELSENCEYWDDVSEHTEAVADGAREEVYNTFRRPE